MGLAERYKQQELHYISGSPVCISGSHPCMSVFHYGTILPQSPNNALPWPMCWRRETQKRSCISGSQPCISARLLACRTNASPTVWGLGFSVPLTGTQSSVSHVTGSRVLPSRLSSVCSASTPASLSVKRRVCTFGWSAPL